MDQVISPATLIMAVVFGMTASYLASRKKWNPYLWFFLGFIFGIVGLFAVFMVPPKKKVRRRAPAPKRTETPTPVLQGPSDKFWFYLDASHAQVGPISYNAIVKALHQGQISKTTYVWHENLTDWKKASDLYPFHSKNTQENRI